MRGGEPARPVMAERVHYVSYGTPRGEYTSTCRAAIVSEVGAWMPVNPPTSVLPRVHGDLRTVTERWEADTVWLFVMNPSGTFHNRSRHDAGRRHPEALAVTFEGGTWHRLAECPDLVR